MPSPLVGSAISCEKQKAAGTKTASPTRQIGRKPGSVDLCPLPHRGKRWRGLPVWLSPSLPPPPPPVLLSVPLSHIKRLYLLPTVRSRGKLSLFFSRNFCLFKIFPCKINTAASCPTVERTLASRCREDASFRKHSLPFTAYPRIHETLC